MGSSAALKILLEDGRLPIDGLSENGSTPLFVAADHGQLEAARVLLSYKANASIRPYVPSPFIANGPTPAEVASLRGHHELAALLGTRKKLGKRTSAWPWRNLGATAVCLVIGALILRCGGALDDGQTNRPGVLPVRLVRRSLVLVTPNLEVPVTTPRAHRESAGQSRHLRRGASMPHEHDEHDHGGHNCIHDHLNERRTQATTLTPQQYGVPLVPRSSAVPRGRSLSAAVSHTFPEAEAPKRRPLRIHVDTSHVDSDPGRACFKSGETVTTTEYGKKARCSYGDVITDAKRELLKKRILPRATDFLERMLSVHRVDGPLRLGSIACGYEGGVRVPEWMRDKGLDDAVRAHCMRTRA